MRLANGRVSTFEIINTIEGGSVICSSNDIQGCYTYAFWRYAALMDDGDSISQEQKPC